MKPSICTALLFSLLVNINSVSAFAPNNLNPFPSKITKQSSSSMSMLQLGDISAINSASTFVSTISVDIDSIPRDDFATVFAGGITVMIGGVLSTVIVGFLLESGNSYASVVADSYAQGGDEEFWESLSPEDQVKTRELMEKLRQSKEGKKGNDNKDEIPGATATVPKPAADSAPKTIGEKKEEVSMFSDYED
jgi:hypothetical protein